MYKAYYSLAVDSQEHDYLTDFDVILAKEIRFKKNIKYGLRVENIKISNTFPQVDRYENTIVKINLDVVRSQYIFQDNFEGFANINQVDTDGESIHIFNVKLIDNKNAPIDLRGGFFTFDLIFYEYRNIIR